MIPSYSMMPSYSMIPSYWMIPSYLMIPSYSMINLWTLIIQKSTVIPSSLMVLFPRSSWPCMPTCHGTKYITNISNVIISLKLKQLSSPRAKQAGPKGLRAESARAVIGRRCPHENGCNSGTESQKIVPQVGNERSLRGLQTLNRPSTKIGIVWQISDFLAQNRDFRPKKKAHFLTLTMFWPRPEKVVQRKKFPFPK